MSIVIAKEIEGIIIIFSDCKVSVNTEDKSVIGGNKLRLSPLENILKTYVIADGVCISYAGDVEAANIIINEFKDERPKTIEELFSSLQVKIRKYDADVEFILCLARGVTERYIYRVTENEIESSNSVWIGEKAAFSKFQEIYRIERENARDELKAFQQAFRKLINESVIPTIGDFIVETVFSNYPCFFYAQRLDSDRGLSKINIKADDEKILDEGNVEIGSYQVSTLVSNRCNKPAVAHFFSHGNFGILFIPLLCMENEGKGITYKCDSIESFIKQVKDEHDIDLIGFKFSGGIINTI